MNASFRMAFPVYSAIMSTGFYEESRDMSYCISVDLHKEL